MIFVFCSAVLVPSYLPLPPVHTFGAATDLLRHRLEMSFGIGLKSRFVMARIEPKPLKEKGIGFGNIYFFFF